MLPSRPFRREVGKRPEGGLAIAERQPRAAGEEPSRVPKAEGRRWAWLPPLLWAAVILGASSLEELQTRVGGIAIRDKLAHFGEYFVFGWLVARSFDGRGWRRGRHFAWTLLIGVVLGTLDELYQGFVPGRERDPIDLLADLVGTTAGWYFSREDRAVAGTDAAAGHP